MEGVAASRMLTSRVGQAKEKALQNWRADVWLLPIGSRIRFRESTLLGSRLASGVGPTLNARPTVAPQGLESKRNGAWVVSKIRTLPEHEVAVAGYGP